MVIARAGYRRGYSAALSLALSALMIISTLVLVGTSTSLQFVVRHVDVTTTQAMPSSAARASDLGYALLESASESLNSTNWTNITTAGGPSPRYGQSMAYDPKDGYVVMFGGASKSGEIGLLNDTWTFKGGVWTNITSTAGPAPGPRMWASLTWDAADGYLFLTGGGYCDSATFNESCNSAWGFVGGHWREIDTSVPYYDSFGACSVYDSSDGYVLVVPWWGSYSSSYLNGTWKLLHYNNSSNQPEPDLAQFTLVDYPPDHGILLYGGRLPPNVETSTDQTWLFSGGNWTDLTSNLTSLPPPLTDAAGAFDPSIQAALLFGGYSEVDLNQTWLFNGTWSRAYPSISPPACDSGSLAWDGTDNVSVLFGGQCYVAGPNSIQNATWEWGANPIMAGLQISATPSTVDVGAAVAFNASFLGGVGPYSYSWQFGDGGTSTSLAPVHVFTESGNRIVNLVVNDSANDSLQASFNLTVVSTLMSGISGRPNPTDAGLPTFFFSKTTGGTGAASYSWSFGDGEWNSSQAPVHTYSSAGTFNVIEWVNDTGGGRATSRLSEIVNAALGVPLVTASPASPELGQPANFSVAEWGGTPPYTYSWAFGDGGTGGNLSNITHIYTTNGPFDASVKVTDSAGQVTVGQLSISIRLQAVAGLTSVSQTSPFTVSFVGQAQGGSPPYAFDWDFGDGTPNSTAQNPVHTYANSGVYVAALTVTDSNGVRTSNSLIVRLTPVTSTPSSTGGMEWLDAFIVTAVLGAAIAAAWVVDHNRRRARRAEGTRWIEELTVDTSREARPPGK
jgi:PKD repeat protein